MLVVDTAAFERALFSSGSRGIMIDPRTRTSREPNTSLSVGNLLNTLGVNVADLGVTLHNSGNDAFMTLWALQKLLDPDTKDVRSRLRPKIATTRPGSHTRMSSDDVYLGRPTLRTLGSSMEINKPAIYMHHSTSVGYGTDLHLPTSGVVRVESSPVRRVPQRSPDPDDIPLQKKLEELRVESDSDSLSESSESSE